MIIVKYEGRLGNNFFQYCFGRILHEKYGSGFYAEEIKGFVDTTCIRGVRYTNNYIVNDENVDFKMIEEKINNSHNIILTGYFQDYRYYVDHKDIIKKWLNIEHIQKINDDNTPHDLDIVCHIRLGDIFETPHLFPHHRVCPKSYFENIFDSKNFKTIYIVTDSPNTSYIEHFKRKYDNLKVVSVNQVYDFCFLMQFKEVVLCQSTFCWWAAWLSVKAERIHYPCICDWKFNNRPGFNFIVHDEPRYVYYKDIHSNVVLIGPGIKPIPSDGWGAVETIVWEYYQELSKYEHITCKIINKQRTNDIISELIQFGGEHNIDVVHIMYDDHITLVPYLKKYKLVLYTSHYAYLQDEYFLTNSYNNIFKKVIVCGKQRNFNIFVFR